MGDYEIIARHVFTTSCESIAFAACWFTAHYYYDLERNRASNDWESDELTVSCMSFVEINEPLYNELVNLGMEL